MWTAVFETRHNSNVASFISLPAYEVDERIHQWTCKGHHRRKQTDDVIGLVGNLGKCYAYLKEISELVLTAKKVGATAKYSKF